MILHREGYRILIRIFLILAALNTALILFTPVNQLIRIIISVLSVLSFSFVVIFFRLPRRDILPDNSVILSPADGEVVVIEEVFEKEYFRDKRLQVSIFMSPLNMHSNRYPVSGIIRYVKHHPGKYLVAWLPKSSELNEMSSIVIEDENGVEIMVRQIAGALARRIVTYSKLGDRVVQGDELGFIKFGSRVDIFLPAETEVDVALNKQVRANRTVLSKIK